MIKAILLAAGQSKRLKSENKLIKKFKNKALINHPLKALFKSCLLYTSPSPRDGLLSRMPSSA